MEPDLEHKLERLCSRYRQAEADLALLMPQRAVTRRQQRDVIERSITVVRTLTRERRPASVAIVRLCYVRGLRAAAPSARLNEDQQAEIAKLNSELEVALSNLEVAQMNQVGAHLRFMNLAERLKSYSSGRSVHVRPPDRFPLEQRARATLRSILDRASMAGALAGTQAGSYDGGTDGK